MSAVTIPKGPIALAGLLHEPPAESTAAATATKTGQRLPAIIVVHPGGGVKEQTAGTYARRLAAAGFTTLCFDASHQGESGGDPRFLEDPAARVSDIWAVVDYLEKVVGGGSDAAGIAVVGICAGGGYAVAAAKADHRIRAVATVSMVNIGDSARLGWEGADDPSRHAETLRGAAAQISAENAGAQESAAPYVPSTPGPDTPADLAEASDYYLTARGQHPRALNRMLFKSFPRVLTFDAFHLADMYLTQPVLLVAGQRAGSLWHTERLSTLLSGRAKKVVVPDATHVDFYDKEPMISTAVQEIVAFMSKNLK